MVRDFALYGGKPKFKSLTCTLKAQCDCMPVTPALGKGDTQRPRAYWPTSLASQQRRKGELQKAPSCLKEIRWRTVAEDTPVS